MFIRTRLTAMFAQHELAIKLEDRTVDVNIRKNPAMVSSNTLLSEMYLKKLLLRHLLLP